MESSGFFRNIFSVRPLYGLGPEADSVPVPDAAAQAKDRPWLSMLILAVVFGAGYYFFIFNRAWVELELKTDTRTVLKIYWPDQQGKYTEAQMAALLLRPNKSKYAVQVTDISKLDHLRLDPSEKKGAKIAIRRIAVRQNGFPPLQLNSKDDFAKLQVKAGVLSASRPEQGGIVLDIQDSDPQLELTLPELGEKKPCWPDELGRGIVILLLATGCCLFSRAAADFMPLLASCAFALILAMAVISAVNTHPDELLHISAGEYYQDHSLPPKAGDPAIAQTYSVYGVSRLHSGEPYYLLAGKFLRLLQPFPVEPYIVLRLFNVLLFFSLILYAQSRTHFRMFLLPLLISPQVWYVFSYSASDALAIFMSILAAYQLAGEQSAFNAMLRDEGKKCRWTVLLLGIFFGLLLLQKKNFYFTCLFFLCYFLWRLWITKQQWRKSTVLRLAALILICSSLFVAMRVTDSWINDFRKKELVSEAREKYADLQHKPSTPFEKKHPFLQIKERNVSLKNMLTGYQWGGKTFNSMFGMYGYSQYSASPAYYGIMQAAVVLLLLTLGVSAFHRGGVGGIILLGIFAVWALLLVGTMCYTSWTADFQPQGRYLLPMLPMASVLCYHCQRIVIKPVFYTLFLILFSLSIYSFLTVGLFDIGKTLSL
ncbi:hypothetical protein VU07_03070 [Desulfobulbus sp. F4]|nr:hypothetical protein [Desulfobulbus sp. F3]MCW5200780.1 hypothetical protein [Desulfobulbus sp. F4]